MAPHHSIDSIRVHIRPTL